MTPEVSAVVVSHRSAAEAAGCVLSLARAFTQERNAGEVVLVDCGSGEQEAALLRDVPADRSVLLPENRGYSGGVNAGLAQARGARLLLSNADVVFSPGSIAPLLDAIAEPRVGAAAPLSTWDTEGRVRLPPGYAPGLFRDAAQLLSGLFPALDRRRFASFARATLRLWERGGRVPHLSGAALALSPNPSGLPFAGADLSQEFRLPDEVESGLASGLWYLTIFRKADGRPLERFVWEKQAA